MNREHTNGVRQEPDVPRQQIVRMKVIRGTARPDPADPTNPDANEPTKVAICKLWDGVNTGQQEIPVLCGAVRKTNDEIFATRPAGGTGATNPETATTPGDESTEMPVIWREIFVADTFYRLQITGYAPIVGQVNKWRYSWGAVKLVRYNQWVAADTPQDTDILSGVPAYNTCEANNSSAGWQGNSVNVDNLPPGVNIEPIQGNPVVRAWVETNCDGQPELYFTVPNAITINCA